MLDEHQPVRPDAEAARDRPPIVVPATSATTPKAVTQPPPWDAGVARVTAPIPRAPLAPRDAFPSAEEISSSHLLVDDAAAPVAASPGRASDELSASLLLDDTGSVRVPLPDPALSAKDTRRSLGVPRAESPGGQGNAGAYSSVGRGSNVSLSGAGGSDSALAADGRNASGNVSEAQARLPADMLPTIPLEAWKPTQPDLATDPIPNDSPDPTRSPSGDPPGEVDANGAELNLATVPQAGGMFSVEAVRRAARRLGAMFPAPPEIPGARPRWFLPAVAAAGLGVGIALVAIVGSLARRDRPSASLVTSTSAVTSSAPIAQSSVPGPVPPPAPPAPPCVTKGSPRLLAPAALVGVGLEVRSLGPDAIGLGFASSEHDAIALRVDPVALSTTSATARMKGTVRHVLPVVSSKGHLGLAVDTEQKNDAVRSRRTVSLDPPLQVGTNTDGIVWSRPEGPPAGTIWRLEGDGSVDALRAVVTRDGDDETTAVAFRRGNAIYVGAASGREALTPATELFRFEGLGPAIGSPAVAIGEDTVMAAWADRPNADEPWRLRWVRFHLHDAAPAPTTFVPPDGGRGQQAMSPALTALPGGRFVFVWTEGPPSAHDVRAVTLSESGETLGSPLSISAPGSNAGQGQAAVTPSGDGVVAFLESTDNGFQVVATPIACPASETP